MLSFSAAIIRWLLMNFAIQEKDTREYLKSINFFNVEINCSLFFGGFLSNNSYETLEYQHRMRSSISRLLVPSIYANLKDHESVDKYPHVRGLQKDVFFINHTELEDKVCLHMMRLLMYYYTLFHPVCPFFRFFFNVNNRLLTDWLTDWKEGGGEAHTVAKKKYQI